MSGLHGDGVFMPIGRRSDAEENDDVSASGTHKRMDDALRILEFDNLRRLLQRISASAILHAG